MNYEVKVVGDDELPEGTHAVIVERDDALPLLIVNGAPARVWSLMRAYEDALESPTVPSVLLQAV